MFPLFIFVCFSLPDSPTITRVAAPSFVVPVLPLSSHPQRSLNLFMTRLVRDVHEGAAVEVKVQESRDVRLITAPGFFGGEVLESALAGETL